MSILIGRTLIAPEIGISYCTLMPSPQDELEYLKSQVAALTARVYALERKSGAAWEASPRPIPIEQPAPQAPPLGRTMLQPATAPVGSGPFPPASVPTPQTPRTPPQPGRLSNSGAKHQNTDLEKKIGQYWLNRIGIVNIFAQLSIPITAHSPESGKRAPYGHAASAEFCYDKIAT
jgi:hypothetical protein